MGMLEECNQKVRGVIGAESLKNGLPTKLVVPKFNPCPFFAKITLTFATNLSLLVIPIDS
jgi:hypothetical protein